MLGNTVEPHEIRARRRALGMSQDELAAAIGTDRSYVSMLESGRRRPGDDTVGRRADALSPAHVVPPCASGVASNGAVRMEAETLPMQPVIAIASGSFAAGSELEMRRCDDAADGSLVLVGEPGRDRAWLGKLGTAGPVRVVELDGSGDMVVISRGLKILARAVRVSRIL